MIDFVPEQLGKINFYLEALDRDVKKPHENPSIGILLCKAKDDDVVEYAAADGFSLSSISPFGIDHVPISFFDQNGPPGWTKKYSIVLVLNLYKSNPALVFILGFSDLTVNQ